MTAAEVLVDVSGRMGRLTLNRPRALNALTAEMVQLLDDALSEWEHDPEIACVLIDGEGDRGLCAGGDIRAIYDAALVGDPAPKKFWRDEYRLNARIKRYPKPYVAIMDGIVMGGGVGVSAHGSVRVVTERTKIAMPEVGIGFVPDVGGTYLLSRAPGELGTHAALTAAQLGPAEAIKCGFADHFVPSDSLASLAEDLANAGSDAVDAAVQRHSEPVPPSTFDSDMEWINECYATDDVAEIVRRLRSSGVQAAERAAGAISAKSPTALKVSLRALRTARGLDTLEDCLEQEYRTSCALLSSPDLVEGIRAQVVDKDRNPQWSPGLLDEVSADVVEKFYAAGDDELGLATMEECDD
ncbi:enoyl-CoA hydratase/isomerase family protein [Saccharopolyspora karakumensis]|uniref:3-hydroxyisobutyryl-CoA hydrolase n=1 Tax=Saccharopolyspora karakumensis TaxID=2530386 RepID=A0A4R5B8D4_9PSEU|nr:enoyl-CoA hydratase/isomerase family protein [Saccharopolyspora karakumensis]TDD80756.1 enoyl-CoA hydratase/isomerase family protein [Saccharopolyspora karakumensis]